MNKVLLFDADGVMTIPKEFFTQVYARTYGLDPEPFEVFFRTEWPDFVTGKKDLKQHITEHPELWQWHGDADSLLQYWFEVEDARNEELIELIRDLRSKGFKCFLATEQEKYRTEYMKEVMFPELFDGYFNTAEIGVKKSDSGFYEAVLASLKERMPDLKPEEVTFFDDSQSKVDVANGVGIKGILYTGIECVKLVVV